MHSRLLVATYMSPVEFMRSVTR